MVRHFRLIDVNQQQQQQQQREMKVKKNSIKINLPEMVTTNKRRNALGQHIS